MRKLSGSRDDEHIPVRKTGSLATRSRMSCVRSQCVTFLSDPRTTLTSGHITSISSGDPFRTVASTKSNALRPNHIGASTLVVRA